MAFVSSGKVTSGNQFHDYAAGTFEDGASYEWQVRTYDAQGVAGPWSGSGFFDAATPPPGASITAPISGATIGLATVELSWSYPSQDAYQWQVLDESATVAQDSGTVESTTTRTVLVEGLPNNVTRTLRVRVRDGGLWSPWASVTCPVSYTPPMVPQVTLMEEPEDGCIAVGINNPAPTNGEPGAAYNNVWITDPSKPRQRRAMMLPTNTSWTYWDPPSGFDGITVGLVQVETVGTNGAVSWSDVPEPGVVVHTLSGGSPSDIGNAPTTTFSGGTIEEV